MNASEAFKAEREFKENAKKASHEEQLADAAVVGAFRKTGRDLATKDHTGLLYGLNFDNLGISDANLFKLYERGLLTVKIAITNLGMLRNSSSKNAPDQIRFINYLLYRLREDAKQNKKDIPH